MQESYYLSYMRETAYPCPAGAYDCGWPGAFNWRTIGYNSEDTLHTARALPAALVPGFGAYGAGVLDGSATFDVRPRSSRVRVTAIVAGDVKLSWGLPWRRTVNTGGWELLEMAVEADNWDASQLAIEGRGYVHMILVEEDSQPDSPTPTVTYTPTGVSTPMPTVTFYTPTWTPGGEVTTVTPTPTVKITETPTPSYAELQTYVAELENVIDEQRVEIDQLRTWYQSARRDIDRIMQTLDSWSADE